jgi:hypothetical protein
MTHLAVLVVKVILVLVEVFITVLAETVLRAILVEAAAAKVVMEMADTRAAQAEGRTILVVGQIITPEVVAERQVMLAQVVQVVLEQTRKQLPVVAALVEAVLDTVQAVLALALVEALVCWAKEQVALLALHLQVEGVDQAALMVVVFTTLAHITQHLVVLAVLMEVAAVVVTHLPVMAVCIMAALAGVAQFASFTHSLAQLARSHQQIQVICNAQLFWIMDIKTTDASSCGWDLDLWYFFRAN